MTTAVEIANIALNNLGDKTISSFGDNTAQAFAVKNRFTDVVNQVLRSHPWNCMTKRKNLTKIEENPVWEFDNAFSLPADYLRILSLKEEDDFSYPWRLEAVLVGSEDQLVLVTDSDTANVSYVRRYTGSGDHDQSNSGIILFDSLLTHAIGLSLAGEIAMDLTGQSQLRDLMLGKYQTLLSEARSINAQEGTAKVIESNEWIEARQRSSSGYFRPFSASTASGVT